ncbi:Uncharacterised protein [Serratia ficaria]|uniref:helix-turn-helix transcriptional regulator n=1 Tax=Serratia ficaria TaxID=61651 RepID=UPI002179F1C0|nr:helix-turn-helix transcriptional regulator [Serratia ficaria]CAI2037054.1 Uncharacterised protein [Serratia ficaria]CAI2439328.1 Uncharacterised protein [Serratia ficaria]
MSRKQDVKNFLTNQRASVDPADYGFNGQNRRVPGLRREEVAQLAAVSVSWYTWLEQGRDINISYVAVRRIGKVLQLTPTEQAYLEALVFGAEQTIEEGSPVSPEVMAMVDALNPHPAFVRRANLDIIYWNRAAKERIFDWSSIPPKDRNSLKLMFINDEYRRRIFDWETAAAHTIAAFRAYYGASSNSESFDDVIQDLLNRSEPFRTMWARHNVSKIGAGNKTIIDECNTIHHYTYTSLEIESSPGMYLIFYLAGNSSSD